MYKTLWQGCTVRLGDRPDKKPVSRKIAGMFWADHIRVAAKKVRRKSK